MSLKLTVVARTLKAAVKARVLLGAFTRGIFLKILEIADTFAASEAISKAFGRPLSDNSGATDSPSKEPGKNVTDSSVSTDDNTIEIGKSRADSSTTSDDETLQFGKSPSDIAPVSEDHRFDIGKLIEESLYGTDDLDGETSIDDDQEVDFTKVRSDLSFASELFAHVTAKSLSDAGEALENISIGVSPNKADSAYLADDQSFALTKLVSDAPTTSESLAYSFGSLFSDSSNAAESEVKSIGKIPRDSAASVDSGSLISQGYTVDNTYFAEDYVGDSRTFT